MAFPTNCIDYLTANIATLKYWSNMVYIYKILPLLVTKTIIIYYTFKMHIKKM